MSLSDTRGWCTYTISDKEFFVDDEKGLKYPIPLEITKGPKAGKKFYPTWAELRPRSLIIPVSTQAEYKKFFMDYCHKYPSACSDYIGTWERKVDKVERMQKK